MNNAHSHITFVSFGRITVGTVQCDSIIYPMTVFELAQDTVDYVKERPGIHLLLNFSQVDIVSNILAGELLRINALVTAGGGTLRLCGLNRNVRGALKAINLDKVVEIDDEVEGAAIRFARSLVA
ncbi:MAG: hypothetical protein HY706_13435, partial [Candidatus Hydrogenedentes bacterium]|nr:hypothetical protein [Candidatus Hydrogenedentota bacterium]